MAIWRLHQYICLYFPGHHHTDTLEIAGHVQRNIYEKPLCLCRDVLFLAPSGAQGVTMFVRPCGLSYSKAQSSSFSAQVSGLEQNTSSIVLFKYQVIIGSPDPVPWSRLNSVNMEHVQSCLWQIWPRHAPLPIKEFHREIWWLAPAGAGTWGTIGDLVPWDVLHIVHCHLTRLLLHTSYLLKSKSGI